MKKYAIVTGAASGIGLNISSRLAEEGVRVFGIDSTLVKNSLFEFYQCDVSNEQSIIKTIQTISSETSYIDYLINVAGVLTVNKKCLIKDISLNDWNKLLSNNLTSMFLMMKYTYSLLKHSNNACIINISSDQSYKGQVGFAPYGISKAGINRLTQVAALEFEQDKIRINAIAPSAVKTNILSSLFTKEEIDKIYSSQLENKTKILLPEDITNMVCFLLSDKANKITGEIFNIINQK
jgi:NAD(P)-dependent dehydrogenase (short-subunit alcohol dehydrogenase family)